MVKSNFLQPPRTKRTARTSYRWAQQTLCKGRTKKGRWCKGKATVSGYCNYHTKRFRQPKKLRFGGKWTSQLDPRSEIIRVECPTYKDYLKTYHWQIVRKYALEFYKRKCGLCGKRSRLHVHHRNYDCLWREAPKDVRVLCRKCHRGKHP